jgi:DNA invertase Pin-like site-specific DNA recombinase
MDAGITVLSVADPELARIDTDPMAEGIVGFKLSIARQEVDDKKRRLNDVFRRMDASGSFRGCPPIGYKVEGPKYGKHLVRDPQRAAEWSVRTKLRGISRHEDTPLKDLARC